MDKIKTNPRNPFLRIVQDFFTEKHKHFEAGIPTVQSEWVQDYLDESAGIKRAMLDAAEARGLDPRLIEIIERFMNLSDERNADGTLGRRMLLFHIRLLKHLGLLFLHGRNPISEKEIIELFIDMDFNKESVCNHYRQELPRMKENGAFEDSNPEFTMLTDKIRELLIQFSPGDTITYEPGAKSFKELVEEVVGDGMM